MAELYYGKEESIQLESKPVTVGTEKSCALTLEREVDELAAAIAAASAAAAKVAAENDLGPGGTGILVEEAPADFVPPMKFFVIQPHAPGHFLKDLAGNGVVKVNGKRAVVHHLVDGDEITAEEFTLEYSNSDMPPGIWDHLEKKRGVRSIRWLLPIVGLVALVVFGFWQWVVYAKGKAAEMERSQAQAAPISNEEAQAILTDLSKTSEERLAEMAPDDLRRIREEFMLSEDATEEEKAANLESLGKMFGVDTKDLLEGGNAADIMAMVDDGGGGLLEYREDLLCEMEVEEREAAMDRLAVMNYFVVEQRKFVRKERQAAVIAAVGRILDGEEAPFSGGTRKFELKLDGIGNGDAELVKQVEANLTAVSLGAVSIKDLPSEELVALRIHETEAVINYILNGHRDESWDAAAMTSIQADARLRLLKSFWGRDAPQQLLADQCGAALNAGCRDPQLLLVRERLAKSQGIELPFEGCGTPLDNAVLIIKRMDAHPMSPFLQSRIYHHGVKVALNFAQEAGLPKLKGMSFESFVDLPIEVATGWNRWIDLGVENVVAGAPKLTNTNVRKAYAAEVRDAYVTYSRARGERESIMNAFEELAELEDGDKVLSSLAKVGTPRR